MRGKNYCALAILASVCTAASAQDGAGSPSRTAQPHYYKFVFRVMESHGDATTSHTYTTIAATGPGASSTMKEGDKVPVVTGSDDGKNIQYQYLDLGTDIETSALSEENGEIHGQVKFAISSVANVTPPINSFAKNLSGTETDPVIRGARSESRFAVTIGKPTIIFSSDHASDKGKTELELTATPIR